MKLSIVGLVIGLASCRDGRPREPAPAASKPEAPAAVAVLDAMDTRVPVPLLPMMANHQKESMRAHLTAVQGIIAAVGARDYDAISRAATGIGYSEPMGQMCQHMGAGAPGFTEQALRFHHTADGVSAAARRHDMPGVLGALSDTLATCTACHAAFKQQVVDETTWASLTGRAGPHPP